MTATRTPTDLRSAVDQGNRRLLDALARGDTAAMAECYTADGQVLSHGFDVVSGRPAIADFWNGALQSGVGGAELETVELAGVGEYAWEVGRYRITAADGAQVDHGKYMVVWKEEHGDWKIHRDMWTSSVTQKS